MDLTQLEKDLLGDLDQDSHSSWEVFEFVRLHHPGVSDDEVFTIGRQLIASWTDRGWLAVSETSQQKSRTDTMVQLLNQIDQMGRAATYAHEGAMSIDLTGKAYEDVPWLQRR